MKTYPLEVSALYDIDGGGDCTFYSKGWHDPEAFAKAVKFEFEDDINVSKVKQIYMRWEMFSGPDGAVQVGQVHYYPGRGIFPVTIVDRE